MYCPKCGTILEQKGDELYCPKGEMYLSKNLEKGFKEMFLEQARTQALKRFSFKVGGTWFCSSCGSQMLNSDGIIDCASCDLNLNEFIPQLVELHPHRGNWK